ncbi:hypothetical protein IWQ60_000870 [Tieghemiomyces parasiticus]|uniref:Uncharacterized protein n=1 Tax=Tieghemiomyces parasiticus TaxID=78921 RepID=A0A9W8AF90_9FUNG|nr:hypothetical protein IWQ60_000870 [Tieghemiomyces parasiticus]
MLSHEFLRAGSQATSRNLLDQLRPELVSMPGFALRSFRTNDLTKHLRTWIFDLLRTNIKACYEKAGWGWHEYNKRKEVFDPATRFLVVYRTATADQPEKPLAFASYRFTMDIDVSGQEIPVLYIYELQVAAHARSRGLGSWLTECILRLGCAWHMDKVVLTCLKKDAQSPVVCCLSGDIIERLPHASSTNP